MPVEFHKEGSRFYVKINGVLGGKASKSKDEAQKYADKVARGLVQFEALEITAVKNINLHINTD
jgi:hypothetical protein